MTVFLPVWNSHCTRVSFTVMVSCSDQLAVHSRPLLCLQRRVAKVASWFFYCWSLLRNNNLATNLQRFTVYYGGRRFVEWDWWTQTSWQVMQRDSDLPIALSYAHSYFVKRSTSKSIARVPNLGYMYSQGYICLSQGVHFRLGIQGKTILFIFKYAKIRKFY